jgi:uncharacterized membrane protein YcaP (DUF421 family)
MGEIYLRRPAPGLRSRGVDIGHLTPAGAAAIAVRTTIVYVGVTGLLRAAGKRELGQLSILDLTVVLLVANAVQNAMVGSDTSVLGGLVSAATLIVLGFAASFLGSRVPAIGRLLEPPATVIVRDGQLDQRAVRRLFLTREEIGTGMREHGIDSLSDVSLGVLEPDGSLSFVSKDEKPAANQRRRHRRSKRLP